MPPTHKRLAECVEIHAILAENSRFQTETLKEVKQDVKDIKSTLEKHNDRLWGLYVKIIVIAACSGGTVAGVLKLVI